MKNENLSKLFLGTKVDLYLRKGFSEFKVPSMKIKDLVKAIELLEVGERVKVYYDGRENIRHPQLEALAMKRVELNFDVAIYERIDPLSKEGRKLRAPYVAKKINKMYKGA